MPIEAVGGLAEVKRARLQLQKDATFRRQQAENRLEIAWTNGDCALF
jgi:hypothetical protein